MRNGSCGLSGNASRAIETEERAGGVASLDDAVGKEGYFVPRGELQIGFPVVCFGDEPEREAEAEVDFAAIQVRGEMAGIGESGDAVASDTGAKAGDEAAVDCAGELGI